MDETRHRLVSERLAVWNGQQVELEVSEENAHGYRFVCYNKDRPHPYYIKLKVDDGPPRTLPGTYSDLAWEAAARYAYFKAYWPKEQPLPEQQRRGKRSNPEVRACSRVPRVLVVAHCAFVLLQEMVVKRAAQKDKTDARLAKREAKKEAENARVRGPAGPGTRESGACCAAVPSMPVVASPVPMQPMQPVLPPIAVELSM